MKSILTDYDGIGLCPFCNRNRPTELHHLDFGAGNRDKSDADGLVLTICSECHRKIHHDKDFTGQASGMSGIIGQLAYEKELVSSGKDKKYARESFRKRYGKSYL